MKNLYLTFTLLFWAFTPIFSQSISSETAIQNSPYIFEGIVVDIDFVQDSNKVYFVSYSIQVQKVLKGKNKLNASDTIELISVMPQGWSILSSGELSRHPQMKSHSIPLSKQKGFNMGLKLKGVFMAKENKTGISQNNLNHLSLEPYSMVSDCFYSISPSSTYDSQTRKSISGYTITGFNELFNSKEEFNTHLKKLKLCSLRTEAIKKKDLKFAEQEELNRLQLIFRI